MDEFTLNINAINDVQDIVASALRNNYKVIVEPIYDAYWKQNIDHFNVTFEKITKK